MASVAPVASAEEPTAPPPPAAPQAAPPPAAPPPPPASPPAESSPQAVPPTPPPPAAAPAPQYAYPPPPNYGYRYGGRWQRPRRSGRGMMIAGIAVFGASYLAPAISGVVLGSADRDFCDCRDAYRLLIPIAGPLTLLHTDDDDDDDGYHLLNALLIFDTIVQSAGLVLAIIGIARFAASAPDAEEEYGRARPPALTFSAAPLPGGGAYAGLRLTL